MASVVFASTPSEYVDKIASLLPDVGRRQRIGEAGRTLVVDRYSFGEIAASLAQRLSNASLERQ